MMERMELPDGWVETIVKTVAKNIQYGYTESSSKEDIGPKFLRITDIQDNKVDWQHVPYCKINEIDKANYLLSDGDLVFARTGATVGKSFLIKGNIPEAIFASYLIRLRFSKDILDKYVWYYFQSPLYWNQIINKQVGTGQPNVNGTTLAALSICIPPLPEQHRIVAAIEALFSSLDRGVASLKTAQQQLKIYRQAVLKWAFEGKLTNEGVKDGELPDGWKWVKLGNIAEAVDPHPSHRTPPVVADGIPYVGIGDIDKNYTKFDFLNARKVSPSILDEHVQRYDISKGDFVIGKIGTIGKPFKIPIERFYALSANVVLIKPKNANCCSEYLYNVTNSVVIESQFKTGSKATTQAAFGIQKVRTLEIPLPSSLSEQHQIVAAIESRLSVCDKLEETIMQSLQQAEALRQSILKKAFVGQLVPQDPNDEPASVLLERIRAERAGSSNPKEHRSNKRKPKSQ